MIDCETPAPSDPSCMRGYLRGGAGLLLGILAMLQPLCAAAVNFERGRQLYGNHCQACHSNLLHTKEERKLNTLSELQQRVAAWGTHAGQDWGPDEVNDVTLYLDRTFYHFADIE